MDGIYFPEGHDHDEWQKKMDERLAKSKSMHGKKDKDDKKKEDPTNPSQPNKLSLSKSLTAALTTKL